MNQTLKTILIVVGVIVAAGVIFVAGAAFSRTGMFSPAATMFGYAGERNYGFGPGMMFGRGAGPVGPGMMGGQRGNYGAGPGMMRGYGWNNQPGANVTPLTIDQARQAADKYIQGLNLQGLAVGEVMVFNNNAYVQVKETATGIGAFELLVDPVSQVANPEPGANMMWNLKYGAFNHTQMMGGRGGMMGGWNPQNATPADVSSQMPVAADQAVKDAQAFLDQYQSGATAAADPLQFYGYYTIDFSKDGQVAGMVSVNGFTGQVFPHTWHGTFVQEGQ